MDGVAAVFTTVTIYGTVGYDYVGMCYECTRFNLYPSMTFCTFSYQPAKHMSRCPQGISVANISWQ
jgi:hypothetical protein